MWYFKIQDGVSFMNICLTFNASVPLCTLFGLNSSRDNALRHFKGLDVLKKYNINMSKILIL